MFYRHLQKRNEERHARDDWGIGGRWGFGHGKFGHGKFGHGKFGRGRGGRVFDHGDLRLVILDLIAAKPRYGYEVIKAIEEQLGGAYSPSPGVVYPTLILLDETGLATVSEAEGNKKLYAVTAAGEAHLAENRAAMEHIRQRIKETREAHGDGPAPQILRAMENLKMALHLRITQGSLSDEQTRAIAAAIDDAVRVIDKV